VQEVLDLEVCSESGSQALRKPHVRCQVLFRALSEPELYPVDFSSMLPSGCPAKLIRSTLSGMDLSSLHALYKDCGGISYQADSFLGVMLLAYWLGIRSSARIEEHCRFDIRFMYVGQGIMPDERTIRRFRRRLDSAVDGLFDSVLYACMKAGLVNKRLVALDGTKIASAASQLARWFTEEEQAEIKEMGLEAPESSDPEARVMKNHSGYLTGYNCQAAVDCDSGIVVAIDVTQCSADRPSLAPMVKEIIDNLGQVPEQVVADTGYDSNEGLEACAKMEVDAIVAIQGQSPNFWTVTPDDEVLCPMGQPATFVGETTDRGKPIQVLRVHGCPSCQFYGECCTTRCGRTLKLPIGCHPAMRILAAYRARGPEGKLAMIERMASIEPVFADIKWNKKMTRLLLRGLTGAKTEWTLMHLVRNLMILARAVEATLTFLFAKCLRNPFRAIASILSSMSQQDTMQCACSCGVLRESQ
jgi:transposase